jgi:hypothetical protein
MKIYTEFEVRKAIELAQECEHECGGVYFDYTKKEIIDELTPIELPSDEEINEVAMIVYGFDARNIKDVLEYKAFKRGAKYVINKIRGDK